ncbi:MAG: hypothetical protein JW800_00895 [Candidatus Omnitrophica bacterium]|nr:hypothetical protein [Candidatus Omnitrophota bacterium]
MRKVGVSAIILIVLIMVFLACIQDSSYTQEEEIPEGMEIKKVGDLQILVPQGARVEKTGKGGLIAVESTSEFTSRKIMDLETRVNKTEETQNTLVMKLDSIEQRLSKIEKDIENSSLVSKDGD